MSGCGLGVVAVVGVTVAGAGFATPGFQWWTVVACAVAGFAIGTLAAGYDR